MHRNISLFAVRSNNVDLISTSNGIIGVWSIYTYSVFINSILHLPQIHLIIGVKRYQFDFNIKVVAGFDCCSMSGLTDHQIGLYHSTLSHFVLSICKHCHDNGLSSSWVAGSTMFSFLILQTNEISCHSDDLSLHLLHQGESITVKRVGISKLFGQIYDELRMLFEGIPWPWGLSFESFFFWSVAQINWRWLVWDFPEGNKKFFRMLF